MFKFIWVTVLLFNGLVVYAGERTHVDDLNIDDLTIDELVEALNAQEQLPLKQQGLTVATIGTDANCTFQAGTGVIQTVIDAGFDEIQLVKGTHTGNIEIADQSLNIKGRYLNCLLAQNDVSSNFVADNSIISGVTGAALPAVRISGDSQQNIVLFEKLNINNGEPAGGILRGDGLDLNNADLNNADVNLTLDTIQVFNNQGTLGGGLSVFGTAAGVTIRDSLVFSNTAEEGGGVYCFGDGSTITMRDTGPDEPSGVSLNSATNGNGGGLYIWGGCEFNSTSGSYGQGGLDFNGIVLNSATGHGGGVYATGGGEVTLGGARRCSGVICFGNNGSNVRVSSNNADSDDDNDGSGGGIYVSGANSTVNLTNVVVADNTAFNGGGLSAAEKAEIYMSSHYTTNIFFPQPLDKC